MNTKRTIINSLGGYISTVQITQQSKVDVVKITSQVFLKPHKTFLHEYNQSKK